MNKTKNWFKEVTHITSQCRASFAQACLDSEYKPCHLGCVSLLSSGLERLSDKTPHLLGPSSIRLQNSSTGKPYKEQSFS